MFVIAGNGLDYYRAHALDPDPYVIHMVISILTLISPPIKVSYTTAFGRVVTMWKVPDFVKPDTGIDRPMEVSATFAICLPEK